MAFPPIFIQPHGIARKRSIARSIWRLAALVDAGEIDGDAHASLVRVEESFADLGYAVRWVLHLPEFKNVAPVRKVFDLGAIPTYPYLHRKHAALAPLLAATLKKRKAKGLIEAYRVQVEKELGWLP